MDYLSEEGFNMNTKRKKLSGLPARRRTWVIKPVQRVRESAKRYNRRQYRLQARMNTRRGK